MKKLIKLAVLIVVLAVFSFSSNPYVVKARKFVIEKGKEFYDQGINKLQKSDKEYLAKTGELFE